MPRYRPSSVSLSKRAVSFLFLSSAPYEMLDCHYSVANLPVIHPPPFFLSLFAQSVFCAYFSAFYFPSFFPPPSLFFFLDLSSYKWRSHLIVRVKGRRVSRLFLVLLSPSYFGLSALSKFVLLRPPEVFPHTLSLLILLPIQESGSGHLRNVASRLLTFSLSCPPALASDFSDFPHLPPPQLDLLSSTVSSFLE